jgi:opacity protein-like surface antigen
MRSLLGLALCFMLAGAAQAQEIRGVYLGVGLGLLNYDETVENTNLRISDSGGIYRFVGGYQLNSNYAIELGWATTDNIGEQFYGGDAQGNLLTLNIGVEHDIATLRVLALAPFGGISMFGGLGYYDSSTKTTFRLNTPSGSESESFSASDSGITVMGGIQFDWSRIALRGEYEWFDTDGNTDASSINLTVLFRF